MFRVQFLKDKTHHYCLKSSRLSEPVLNIIENEIKSQIQQQNLYNENRIKIVEKRIQTLKNRLNKLFNLYLDGQIDNDIYTNKRQEFETELDDLLLEQNSYQKTGVEILRQSELLFELFKNASTLYKQGTIKQKRELLIFLCSNFTYDGENIRITIKKAFQPLVKIAFLENLDYLHRYSNSINFQELRLI